MINIFNLFKHNKKQNSKLSKECKKANTLVSNGTDDYFILIEDKNKVTVKNIILNKGNFTEKTVDIYGSNSEKLKSIEIINSNIKNIIENNNIKNNKKISKYIDYNNKIRFKLLDEDIKLIESKEVDHYIN